jgi:hypothetical protein
VGTSRREEEETKDEGSMKEIEVDCMYVWIKIS